MSTFAHDTHRMSSVVQEDKSRSVSPPSSAVRCSDDHAESDDAGYDVLDLAFCHHQCDNDDRFAPQEQDEASSSLTTSSKEKGQDTRSEQLRPVPSMLPHNPSIDPMLFTLVSPLVSELASVKGGLGAIAGGGEGGVGSAGTMNDIALSDEYDFASWQLQTPPTLNYCYTDEATPLYDSWCEDRLSNEILDEMARTNFTVNPRDVWQLPEGDTASHPMKPLMLDDRTARTFAVPPPPPPLSLLPTQYNTSFGAYLNISMDDDHAEYGLNCRFDLTVPPLVPTALTECGSGAGTTTTALSDNSSHNIQALTDNDLQALGYTSHWPRDVLEEGPVHIQACQGVKENKISKEQNDIEQRRQAFLDLQSKQVQHVHKNDSVSPSSSSSSSSSCPATTPHLSQSSSTTSSLSSTDASSPSSCSLSSSQVVISAKQAGERARNACKHCHKRKTKCTEERPTCMHCQQVGAICEYPTEIRRRGKGKHASRRRDVRAASSASSSLHHGRRNSTAPAPPPSSSRAQSAHSDDSYRPSSSARKRSKR